MTRADLDKMLASIRHQHELLQRTTPIEEAETLLSIPRSPSWTWGNKTHVAVPGLGKGRIQTDIIPGGGTGCLAWFTYAQIKQARDGLAAAIAEAKGEGA